MKTKNAGAGVGGGGGGTQKYLKCMVVKGTRSPNPGERGRS